MLESLAAVVELINLEAAAATKEEECWDFLFLAPVFMVVAKKNNRILL